MRQALGMRDSGISRVLCVLSIAILGTLAVSGCESRSDAATGSRIDIAMKDFHLRASRSSVRSGDVLIRVHNAGPSTHEINLDRTAYPSRHLPLKSDGLTVNEDAKGLHRVDSIEELPIHHVGDLSVRLKPGHYVLYCNLEGHYLGGMHVDLEVR